MDKSASSATLRARTCWTMLTRLEFYSMISRIPVSDDGDDGDEQQSAFDLGVDKPPVDYVIVDTEEALESLVSTISTPAGILVRHGDHVEEPDDGATGGAVVLRRTARGMVPASRPLRGRRNFPSMLVLDALGPVFTDLRACPRRPTTPTTT